MKSLHTSRDFEDHSVAMLKAQAGRDPTTVFDSGVLALGETTGVSKKTLWSIYALFATGHHDDAMRLLELSGAEWKDILLPRQMSTLIERSANKGTNSGTAGAATLLRHPAGSLLNRLSTQSITENNGTGVQFDLLKRERSSALFLRAKHMLEVSGEGVDYERILHILQLARVQEKESASEGEQGIAREEDERVVTLMKKTAHSLKDSRPQHALEFAIAAGESDLIAEIMNSAHAGSLGGDEKNVPARLACPPQYTREDWSEKKKTAFDQHIAMCRAARALRTAPSSSGERVNQYLMLAVQLYLRSYQGPWSIITPDTDTAENDQQREAMQTKRIRTEIADEQLVDALVTYCLATYEALSSEEKLAWNEEVDYQKLLLKFIESWRSVKNKPLPDPHVTGMLILADHARKALGVQKPRALATKALNLLKNQKTLDVITQFRLFDELDLWTRDDVKTSKDGKLSLLADLFSSLLTFSKYEEAAVAGAYLSETDRRSLIRRYISFAKNSNQGKLYPFILQLAPHFPDASEIRNALNDAMVQCKESYRDSKDAAEREKFSGAHDALLACLAQIDHESASVKDIPLESVAPQSPWKRRSENRA